ncbi:MAG: hypothetical protein PPP58_10260 [Natronomonas sp.]
MHLEELQSVQAGERQSSDLQHLRPSFYDEVGRFIEEMRDRRASVVETADDPFSSPEVRRLTDDIETAENTVEAIYERRVGKIVKKASIAAAGMPVDDDGLTAEEQALFEDLVDRIESNRETVFGIVDGESPSVSCTVEDGESAPDTERQSDPAADHRSESPSSPVTADSSDRTAPASGADTVEGSPEPEPPDPEPADEHRPDGLATPEESLDEATTQETETPTELSAADLMGTSEESDQTDGTPRTNGGEEPAERPREATASPSAASGRDSADAGRDATAGSHPASAEADPRTTVRITADVGEIVGTDNRDYQLSREDVVSLPEPNASVLLENDAAERLD